MDIWSAGCIFVELLLHSTVPFFPGNNHVKLLESILDTVGPPSHHFLAKFPPSKVKEFVQIQMAEKVFVPTLKEKLSSVPKDGMLWLLLT